MVMELLGQNLDPIYRYIENGEVKTAESFAVGKVNGFYEANGYYQVYVTTPKTVTAATYSTSSVTQAPSYYLYTQYQKDSADRETTVYCSSQMSTYYVPAINALTNDEVVNEKLMLDAKALLQQTTFAENQTKFLETVSAIIESALNK